jgi:hypothetical protein
MRSHFLPPEQPKMLLGRDRGSDVSVVEWLCEVIICLLMVAKCDYDEVDIAMFLGVKARAKSFSAFWSTFNATWVMSRKRYFME